LDASCLLEQEGRRGGLHHEGEAAVTVNRDHNRGRSTGLQGLGLGIERLAELHDVDAVLTQSGANRRTRVCLPGLHLQLDVSVYLLCHLLSPDGSLTPREGSRPCRLPDGSHRHQKRPPEGGRAKIRTRTSPPG